MVHARTALVPEVAQRVGSQDREMAAAGARFESYVKEAMREAEIPSLAELSRRSGIAVSAWHGWFRGERRPRRNSLVLAGEALSRTPEQLAATWQGERPQKTPRPQTDAVLAAIEANTAMLEKVLTALLQRPPDPDAVERLRAEAEAAASTRPPLRQTSGR